MLGNTKVDCLYFKQMPVRRMPLQVGNFYHIYNRGNNRQLIFFERENYIYFLQLVRRYLIANSDILPVSRIDK